MANQSAIFPFLGGRNTLQHTAKHRNRDTTPRCNPLQHTATHCNTPQHAATRRNTPQHAATHYNTLHHAATRCIKLQRKQWCLRSFLAWNLEPILLEIGGASFVTTTGMGSAGLTVAHFSTLQHTAIHCSATHYNTLQHAQERTRQHTATHLMSVTIVCLCSLSTCTCSLVKHMHVYKPLH